MILALVAALGQVPQSAAREVHFTVPPDFVVDRPSDLSGSLISLAFAEDGSAYVGRESEGIVRLSDLDHDGRYERKDEIAPELTMCQGIAAIQHYLPSLAVDRALLATGSIAGKVALWRVPLDEHGLRSGTAECLLQFSDGGEHGPHAIVRDPGSEYIVYVVVGNHADFTDSAGRTKGYWAGDEGRLLAPYMDPLGFGTRVRYPGGFVARVYLKWKTWDYVAVGIRNAFDMAIDEYGRKYAVDSDMEWDVGLPWYRPVRLLRITDGADYGSRAGSSVIPEWCVDTQQAELDLGRGSPTGAVFGTKLKFPIKWQSALFSGDWAQGKIQAIWPPETCVDFLTADGALPVTDLAVGPGGTLWFLTGGRGTRGAVHRVSYSGGESTEDLGVRDYIGYLSPRHRLEEAAREIINAEPARIVADRPSYGPFDAEERATWPLKTRIESVLADDKRIEELATSELLEQRIMALFQLAPTTRIEGRADKVATLGLQCLDAAMVVPKSRAELTLAVLRAFELGLLRQGDPSTELAQKLSTRLLTMFPNDDERIAGEVGVLLSHLDDARALEPLMAAMSKSPQPLAIHYADCVHRMTHGWDGAKRLAMLEWFARSSEYTGGISLPGYLSAMRATFIGKLPPDACAELAAAETLDAESLALLLARLPEELAARNFPHFEQALARIVPKAFGTGEQARKDAALRALLPLHLPAIEELARALAKNEGDVLEAPWTLLARTPDAHDYDLWLAAIVLPSAEKREQALGALAQIARKPELAADWRNLIDHARELGARRGRELARTLARWCVELGGSAPAGALAESKDFDAALAALEVWYAGKFPDGRGPTNLDPNPHWSEEKTLAFLARAKSRPGSPSLGRLVFESASCSTCHAVGATAAIDRRGFGPDLAHVTDRLSDADLLAAIVAPSRVISDQYRAFVARTKDERMFEGIVRRQDAQGVLIQPTSGEPIEIDSEDLESLEPSLRSPMPDGLLESRTLEEVRDLFAYLKSPSAQPAAKGWSPLLGPGGLSGWDGDPAVWSLRGATLIGRSSGLAKSSYILAPMPTQDMCVEFDVFLPPGGNSGLCYRAERPSDPAASDPSGAQADLGQAYWGTLYASDRGTLTKADGAALATALDREGWNHVLVRFEGDQHSMEINGLETYSTREKLLPGTRLGFQVHEGEPMQVRIANARWRAP